MKVHFAIPLGTLVRCLPFILSLEVLARQSDFQFDIVADVQTQPTAILKDQDGFIWIGTAIDGVYRFDGKRGRIRLAMARRARDTYIRPPKP